MVESALGAENAPGSVSSGFHDMRRAVDRAAALHPHKVHVSHYRIANRPVTVRLIGDELARRLTRAISHLAVPDGEARPGLRIEMWDERETGVGAPGCEPRGEEGSPGGTEVSEGGRYVLFQQARIRTALDRIQQHITGWVSTADQLTQYEIGRPWHSELLLWQHDCGLQPLHAGFIERNGTGLLLGGPGGSGKSTTSLACMQEGWTYLADDYVSVERDGEGYVGHGTYNSAHLDPTHLQRFPRLVPGAIPAKLSREDKSLVLASSLANVRLGTSASIKVLAFPRVVDRPDSTWRPAGKAESLLRLAPSSLLLLNSVQLGHAAFQRMSDVVSATPTCWLDVGRDLAALPRVVAEMTDAMMTS